MLFANVNLHRSMKSSPPFTDRESLHKIFMTYHLNKKMGNNGEPLIYYYYLHIKISNVLFFHIITIKFSDYKDQRK